MKAQFPIGISLAWQRVIPVFLVDVAILVLVSHWPGDPPQTRYAFWTGVGIAAVLTLVALVTYHRVPLSSALAARVADHYADPDKLVAEETARVVDHRRRYAREAVGIRGGADQLVAAIAVAGRPVPPSGRHHRGAPPSVALPVDAVAAALRQFDVRLHSIDIVTAGVRGPGDTRSITGRRTWLLLRMDPQLNMAAVATRDSLAATLAAATERLAHELDGRDISAQTVSAERFASIDAAVLADLRGRRQRSAGSGRAEPAKRANQAKRAKRKQAKRAKQYVANFWLSPADITSENLERLWAPDTDATVVTIRLTLRHDHPEVAVLVRYHGESKLAKDDRAGLNRFIGRRMAAVRESLPIPERHKPLAVPVRRLDGDETLVVTLDSVDQRATVPVGAQP